MPDDGVLKALAAAGAPPEVLAKARADMEAAAGSGDFEVWPENWDTLMTFLDLQTSWDWVSSGMGAAQRVGIRATELEAALRLRGVRGAARIAMSQDLRAMEGAALHCWRRSYGITRT